MHFSKSNFKNKNRSISLQLKRKNQYDGKSLPS